jgi:hypothetical protein
MHVTKFNFEVNVFALIINFIWHFFEYSLTSFLIQSAIYLNVDLSYLFTVSYFFVFSIKTILLFYYKLVLHYFNVYYLKFTAIPPFMRELGFPYYTKSENPRIIDSPPPKKKVLEFLNVFLCNNMFWYLFACLNSI